MVDFDTLVNGPCLDVFGDAIVLPKLLPGQAFTVQETRPDGKGWAMLLLTKSA